ncbi:MAG: lysine exporter LysO family protein [Stenotrophomonas sp.]|uniref:lysine exporter LysO family protein n=1 Tax=Stenotrophomonas sp. TaxID=69392 RepID=UPI003D6D49F1
MQSIVSLLPILAALVAGWAMRRWLLPAKSAPVLISLIGPMVWCLLFLIGVEFAGALASLDAIGYVLRIAALLVAATTAAPCLLLMSAARLLKGVRNDKPSSRRSAGFDLVAVGAPLKECGTAVAMVCAGVAVSAGLSAAGVAMDDLWLPSSSVMLLSLIVLIGIDLAGFSIGRKMLSWAVICVPLAVIAGSIIGGAAVHLITGEDIRVLLALSCGFGWFTLSSTLVGSLSGELHGAIALVVDLGRELSAIVLLYLFGQHRASLGIAAAGATAMDSTLPIVRQACPSDAIPVALVSGFILTITAPFLITALLTG